MAIYLLKKFISKKSEPYKYSKYILLQEKEMNNNILRINVLNHQANEEDLIKIKLKSEDIINVNYSKLVSQSNYIRGKYKYSEVLNAISSEVNKLSNEMNVKDESIKLFIDLIQEAEVNIPIEYYKDFYTLSEYFDIPKFIQELDNISQEQLYNDLTFTIQILHESEAANNQFNTELARKIEMYLTSRINECFENEKFKEITVSTIYRIIEKSDIENINQDSLVDFIIKSIDTHFILLKFVQLHKLSEDKIEEFFNFFGANSNKNYFDYITFNHSFIRQMKRKFDDFFNEMNQIKVEHKQMKQEYEQIKQELNQTQEDFEQTKQELSQIKEDFEQTKQELNQTQENYEQTKQELSQTQEDYEQTKQELNQTQEDFEQTKQELSQTQEDYEQTKQELNQTQEDFEQTKQELNQTQENYKQTKQELNQTQEDYEQTKQELNQTQEDYEQTKQELNQTQKEHKQIKQELSQIKDAYMQTKHSLIQMTKYYNQAKAESLQQDQELDKIKEVYKQAKQELNQSKKENMKTKQELSDMKEEYKRTKQELYQIKRNHIQTKQELSQIKREHVQTKQELYQIKGNHIQTKQELNQIKREHVQTKQELDRIIRNYIQTGKELNNVKINFEQAKDEFNQIKDEVNQMKTQMKINSKSVIVTGYNKFNQLGIKSNNRDVDGDPIISPPLILSFNPSSLLSYSIYHFHSVQVTRNGKLQGIGDNRDGRICGSLEKTVIDHFTDFTINDSSGNQLTPISAVCNLDGTLYMLSKSSGNGRQLAYCDREINGGNPVFLNIGNHEPVALFGGRSHTAAISSEGKVIFINRVLVKESPEKQIEAVSLPDGEKASSVACGDDSVVVLSSKGRVFSSSFKEANCVLKFSVVDELSGEEIVCVSGINNHFLAISKEGCAFGRGSNVNDQLGLGESKKSVSSFTKILSLDEYEIRAAYAGYSHSLFETREGKILSCGSNVCGQLLLSSGTREPANLPTETAITGGATFCIAGNFLSTVFIGSSPPPNTPNMRIQLHQ